MDDPLILVVGDICPNCGDTQFSVECPPLSITRPELPPGVLGFAECRGCQKQFLVKLSPNLQNAFISMFDHKPILKDEIPILRDEILKILFP